MSSANPYHPYYETIRSLTATFLEVDPNWIERYAYRGFDRVAAELEAKGHYRVTPNDEEVGTSKGKNSKDRPWYKRAGSYVFNSLVGTSTAGRPNYQRYEHPHSEYCKCNDCYDERQQTLMLKQRGLLNDNVQYDQFEELRREPEFEVPVVTQSLRNVSIDDGVLCARCKKGLGMLNCRQLEYTRDTVEHIFCLDCMSRYVERRLMRDDDDRPIEERNVQCMIAGCKGLYPGDVLQTLVADLPKKNADEIQNTSRNSIKALVDQNMEKCPRCDNCIPMDVTKEEQPIFPCLECNREYCRFCGAMLEAALHRMGCKLYNNAEEEAQERDYGQSTLKCEMCDLQFVDKYQGRPFIVCAECTYRCCRSCKSQWEDPECPKCARQVHTPRVYPQNFTPMEGLSQQRDCSVKRLTCMQCRASFIDLHEESPTICCAKCGYGWCRSCGSELTDGDCISCYIKAQETLAPEVHSGFTPHRQIQELEDDWRTAPRLLRGNDTEPHYSNFNSLRDQTSSVTPRREPENHLYDAQKWKYMGDERQESHNRFRAPSNAELSEDEETPISRSVPKGRSLDRNMTKPAQQPAQEQNDEEASVSIQARQRGRTGPKSSDTRERCRTGSGASASSSSYVQPTHENTQLSDLGVKIKDDGSPDMDVVRRARLKYLGNSSGRSGEGKTPSTPAPSQEEKSKTILPEPRPRLSIERTENTDTPLCVDCGCVLTKNGNLNEVKCKCGAVFCLACKKPVKDSSHFGLFKCPKYSYAPGMPFSDQRRIVEHLIATSKPLVEHTEFEKPLSHGSIKRETAILDHSPVREPSIAFPAGTLKHRRSSDEGEDADNMSEKPSHSATERREVNDSELSKHSEMFSRDDSTVEEQDEDEKFMKELTEESLTALIIRYCGACGQPYIKENNCNLCECNCGRYNCFICEKVVDPMKHFSDQLLRAPPGQCLLFSNDPAPSKAVKENILEKQRHTRL